MSPSSAAARAEPVARRVPLEEPQQPLGSSSLELDDRDQLVVDQPLVGVEQERLAAGHPRAEVAAVRAEHDDGAARHVLAGVVADALDDRAAPELRTANRSPAEPGAVELAARRAVEARCCRPGTGSPASPAGGAITIRPPAHRLADVVVRLADEIELDAGREERAEALAGRALEAGAHAARRRGGAELLGDRAARAARRRRGPRS